MDRDEEDYIELFEGNPLDQDLFQIWKVISSKEIHVMVNGSFSFVLDSEGLRLFQKAVNTAVVKDKPE